MRAWDIYREILRPARAERLGVRFINQARLPFGHHEDFSRLLTAAPEIPASLPQGVSEFLTRTATVDDATDGRVSIALVTQQFQNQPDQLPLYILDVDVFDDRGFESMDLIPARFVSLHDRAERTFFEMFTEAGIEVFQ